MLSSAIELPTVDYTREVTESFVNLDRPGHPEELPIAKVYNVLAFTSHLYAASWRVACLRRSLVADMSQPFFSPPATFERPAAAPQPSWFGQGFG